jgi:hypothetical protein
MVPQVRYARTSDDVTIAYTVDGQREPTLVWLPPAPFSDVLAQYAIPLLRDVCACAGHDDAVPDRRHGASSVSGEG